MKYEQKSSWFAYSKLIHCQLARNALRLPAARHSLPQPAQAASAEETADSEDGGPA